MSSIIGMRKKRRRRKKMEGGEEGFLVYEETKKIGYC